MALVSPGLQITVSDESQYVPGAVGTVPLVILATGQNKSNPSGTIAADTTASRAGKLLAYSSQRELITAMGYPSFKQSSAGTALHGDERNEYGLMAAYSALGNVNRLYAIRADINLDELIGTSVRPTGSVANNTHWLDLTESMWGINEWDAVTGTFTLKSPLLVTSTDELNLSGGIYVPTTSVGQIGSYAVAFNTGSNALLFYKNRDNTWVRLGTTEWQTSWPTIKGTTTTSIPVNGTQWTIVINGETVGLVNTATTKTVAEVAGYINAAPIDGVTAAAVNGRLEIYADETATSDGTTADGKIIIANGTGTPLATLGIVAGEYANPTFTYGTFAQIPSWRSTDTVPRPSGSIFAKLGATGNGSDTVIKRYNASTESFATLAAEFYNRAEDALYGLDPAGGGNGIAAGTVWVAYDPLRTDTGGFKPFRRRVAGQTIVTGAALSANPLTATDIIVIGVTSIGSASITEYSIELSGSSPLSFVSDVLAMNIPELDISVGTGNAITFTHIYGGDIYLTDDTGTPTADAGFTKDPNQLLTGTILYGTTLALTNWEALTYTFSANEPYQPPADGTLWYYSDAATVDIMVNDIGGWRGYRNTLWYDGSATRTDARGYDLGATDPMGVIISASEPEFQSDGVTALVGGDIWLDSGDLENYPALYRYTGTAWGLIDNTDQVSQNGILFADARWDTDGTTDIITGSLPSITDLIASDYIDVDAPDYRLYPRGMLLFNTRRSGYNVKQYVSNKFNANAYPDLPTSPSAGAPGALPLIKNTWQTASGLKDNGSPYMGRQAQRRMITAAMQAAIIANTDVREEQYQFNIICAPGYPELIDEMVALNNDRANTAFIIGDTPMRLAPNAIDIANWSNNTNGDGLATADPYLGVYYPCGQTSDLSGNTITVPASHMALRTMIYNDNVAYQWFAPAGTRRGLVDNASSIGYIDATTGEYNFNAIREGLRDTLYENKINPITNLPGVGLVVWGQKTRNATASALDRINVARLVNYIRTILATVGNGFLFEPNDKITRDQIKNIISGAVNDLIAKRGVYDYLVICDETNNTPTRIARNELYVDIAIEPMKDVEFIYIPIRLKNPGDIAAGI
jgi:hypothetical protein